VGVEGWGAWWLLMVWAADGAARRCRGCKTCAAGCQAPAPCPLHPLPAAHAALPPLSNPPTHPPPLQIRLDDPAKYQSIVDAEWNIIYDKLKKCVDSGASIVLSRLAIGEQAAARVAAEAEAGC
jgi:hypothetical protein